MAGIAFFVLSFLFVRVLIALVNLLDRNNLPWDKPVGNPRLSILIPARDEENSLPLILQDLLVSDWKNLEVIVYDDQSADRTPEILEEFSARMPNLRWITGEGLPEGWTGKNHACHKLAENANGDYLLFLDADVRVSPDMATKALCEIQSGGYNLVSVFPTQIMKTTGEFLTVPLMNWVLLSLLPLPLVRLTRLASLSAANGQFMLFEAEGYRRNLWHSKVRGEVTEDIVISRQIKKNGGKLATLTGNGDVFCRMYLSAPQAVKGFSKNVHQFFGGSRLVMVVFALTILMGWIPVWLSFGWPGLKYFLVLVLTNRVLVAMASQQNVTSVLLHPVQMIIFARIVIRNLFRKIKGDTEWKGRIIRL
jgi:cellulose synthase/poly-beta-1,6-N-acetylglucosamine synthase-like glycosyltransferase